MKLNSLIKYLGRKKDQEQINVNVTLNEHDYYPVIKQKKQFNKFKLVADKKTFEWHYVDATDFKMDVTFAWNGKCYEPVEARPCYRTGCPLADLPVRRTEKVVNKIQNLLLLNY